MGDFIYNDIQTQKRGNVASELPINNHVINRVLSSYMEYHNPIWEIVYDSLTGFRKGIVVALYRNVLGWSLVNDKADVDYMRLSPFQLPVIQSMIGRKVEMNKIVHSTAFRHCLRNHNLVKVPLFDINMGLMIAFDRAEKHDSIVYKNNKLVSPLLPKDKELKKAFIHIQKKSETFYKEV